LYVLFLDCYIYADLGRGQLDEDDFDPHLFQPTHPTADDEGDETDINSHIPLDHGIEGDEGDENDINQSHQSENQDFLDHGIRQPNEGIYVLTDRIDLTQQYFEQYSILNYYCYLHLGDDYESYRVFIDGANSGNVHDDPYDLIYQNLPSRHKLSNVPDCRHCGAKRFQYEPPGFCCRKGKIHIHIPDVPAQLKRLFTSQVHDDAKYFRKHIRYFNSHFSFTSLGVTLDRRVSTAAGTGIYTFRVQGGLYHRLDHLVPGSHGPRHLQLYFYDTEDQTLAHRAKRSPDLDINIIRNILRILQDNPYVQAFNRVGAVPNLDDYCIELNTDVTPDQRRYNAPTASQVAAIWMEGNDPQRSFDRSVLVYARGDRPRYIKAYHGCYDPLSYPVYHRRGETGWNKFMPYNDTPTIQEPETPAPANVQPMDDITYADHGAYSLKYLSHS